MFKRVASSLKAVLLALALTAPAFATTRTANGKAPDPLSMGPYPVGVTTTVFVDKSREDKFTKEPRTLVTEVWYPATDGARKGPKNKYSNFIPGGVTPEIDALLKQTYRMAAADIDKTYWNEAVRDAGVRRGRFPLVIFSHGNGGSRHQNTFWCDYLASHGYIVASADHTGNARVTIVNGKIISVRRAQQLCPGSPARHELLARLDDGVGQGRG